MIHFLRISRRRWLYWGHEDEVPHAKVWEPFWFREADAPFRIGTGYRMHEVRDLAFHVGIARTYPSVSTGLEVLGGMVLEIPAHEVGLWGVEAASDDAREDPSAARTGLFARAADPDRVLVDVGGQHDEDRRS